MSKVITEVFLKAFIVFQLKLLYNNYVNVKISIIGKNSKNYNNITKSLIQD